MKAYLLRLTLIAGALLSTSAYGQFAAGVAKYQKGDYAGAEQAFATAAKTEKDLGLKSKIYKYLGIAQYNRKAHREAYVSFKQALALNPSIKVSATEVVDETVVAFFNRVRELTTAAAAKPALAAKSSRTAGKGWLVVNSAVPGAQVMVDGIISGAANQPLRVDSGQVQIEVIAKGYSPVKQKVDVVQGKRTTTAVELKKRRSGGEATVLAAAKKSTAEKKRQRAATSDDLFSQDAPKRKMNKRARTESAVSVEDFERDAKLAGKPSAQGRKSGKSAPSPYAVPQYYAVDGGYQPLMMQKSQETGGSTVVSLLPFGAGQFQNGSYFLGAVFLLGQSASLYYSFERGQAADAMVKNRSEFEAERSLTGLTPEDQYALDDTNAAVKRARQQSTAAMGAFAGLWVISAIEALLYEHPVVEPKPISPGPRAPYWSATGVAPRAPVADQAPRMTLAPALDEAGVSRGLLVQANWAL